MHFTFSIFTLGVTLVWRPWAKGIEIWDAKAPDEDPIVSLLG